MKLSSHALTEIACLHTMIVVLSAIVYVVLIVAVLVWLYVLRLWFSNDVIGLIGCMVGVLLLVPGLMVFQHYSQNITPVGFDIIACGTNKKTKNILRETKLFLSWYLDRFPFYGHLLPDIQAEYRECEHSAIESVRWILYLELAARNRIGRATLGDSTDDFLSLAFSRQMIDRWRNDSIEDAGRL
ncbi:hypothetical protein [uncultured Alistipes sp.]|uniref:hypothetical protein n=1 Tax=uncultured Alistipes sp. TaxID=538949 RepID=UPI0026051DEC|nr:hypothetical protein [uncultured Alistipes sp.]